MTKKISILDKTDIRDKIIDLIISDKSSVNKKVEENIDWIFKNKLINNNIIFRIEYKNKPPSYSQTERGNILNIPVNYKRAFNSGFTEAEKFLKEQTFDFFFFHEVGHGFHHSKLSNEQNFSANPVNFKNDLDNLCNNPTRNLIFNTFLKSTYREASADCYAAICLYKRYGDVNIFDKVSEMRKDDLIHHKKTNDKNLFTPYHDYDSVLFLKQEIKNIDLSKINSADEINELIQKSLTKGLLKTIYREAQANDSFVKGLREYGKELSGSENIRTNTLIFFEKFQEKSSEFIQLNELNDIVSNEKLNRDIAPSTMNLVELKSKNYACKFENILKIRNLSLEGSKTKNSINYLV